MRGIVGYNILPEELRLGCSPARFLCGEKDEQTDEGSAGLSRGTEDTQRTDGGIREEGGDREGWEESVIVIILWS